MKKTQQDQLIQIRPRLIQIQQIVIQHQQTLTQHFKIKQKKIQQQVAIQLLVAQMQ